MILFLHNRYRTTGGEERVIDDLMWLVQEHLDERAQLLSRDSASLSRAGAAAALFSGGAAPKEVAEAVRATGATVLHAHNLHPSFGWRSLAAARQAGAAIVLHLHQYRLICAVGVCHTAGQECTRCHGRNTLPGMLHNCRGSRAEALAYGVSLSMWQRRIADLADAVILPSEFARSRLQELNAPLPWERTHVMAPPLRALEGPLPAGPPPDAALPGSAPPPPTAGAPPPARYALVAARLFPEKGVNVAIEACAIARMPLLIAGDGPQRAALEAVAQGAPGTATFLGQVSQERLAQLRAKAAIAIVPSFSAETFGAAAAEAIAQGLPVVASAVGALPQLLHSDCLVPPGDPQALAAAITRLAGDRQAALLARQRLARHCAPSIVAPALQDIYRRAALRAERRARRASRP